MQLQHRHHKTRILGPVVPGRGQRRQHRHDATVTEPLLERQWLAVPQSRDHADRRIRIGCPTRRRLEVAVHRHQTDEGIPLAQKDPEDGVVHDLEIGNFLEHFVGQQLTSLQRQGEEALAVPIKAFGVEAGVDVLSDKDADSAAGTQIRLEILDRSVVEPRHVEQVDGPVPCQVFGRDVAEELGWLDIRPDARIRSLPRLKRRLEKVGMQAGGTPVDNEDRFALRQCDNGPAVVVGRDGIFGQTGFHDMGARLWKEHLGAGGDRSPRRDLLDQDRRRLVLPANHVTRLAGRQHLRVIEERSDAKWHPQGGRVAEVADTHFDK